MKAIRPLFVTTTAILALQPVMPSAAGDLVDVIPGLYGGDGIILSPPEDPSFPSHEAHFTVAAGATINQLNEQIAPEVRPFPINPSAGSVTYEFDPEQGTYRETSDTLGPIITDRPQTLGQGRFSIGMAYSYFEYDEFEGDSLGSLRASALHTPDTLDPDDVRTSFELDVIDIAFDIDLEFNTLALVAAYGVTDKLDLGIIVPIVDVDLDVDASAMVVRSPQNEIPVDVHFFDENTESPNDSGSDDATGIGDIVLAAKYYWLDQENLDAAAGLKVKLETGDEDDFLGTGSTTIAPLLISSYKVSDTINLRANLGFEFDLDDSDRNEFLYNVGIDAGNQTVSGVVDILGRHELDTDGIGEDTIDAAFGLKWRPIENLIFSANLVVPLNDDGLRSDLITTVGFEYRN